LGALPEYFEGEEPMYIPKPDDLVGKRQLYEAYKY
jgi:hypothetical protein